jgi:hypothetical protein
MSYVQRQRCKILQHEYPLFTLYNTFVLGSLQQRSVVVVNAAVVGLAPWICICGIADVLRAVAAGYRVRTTKPVQTTWNLNLKFSLFRRDLFEQNLGGPFVGFKSKESRCTGICLHRILQLWVLCRKSSLKTRQLKKINILFASIPKVSLFLSLKKGNFKMLTFINILGFYKSNMS